MKNVLFTEFCGCTSSSL